MSKNEYTTVLQILREIANEFQSDLETAQDLPELNFSADSFTFETIEN